MGSGAPFFCGVVMTRVVVSCHLALYVSSVHIVRWF